MADAAIMATESIRLNVSGHPNDMEQVLGNRTTIYAFKNLAGVRPIIESLLGMIDFSPILVSSPGLTAMPIRRIHADYVEEYASVVYGQSSREELPFDSHVPEVAAIFFVWAELFERETIFEVSLELVDIRICCDLFGY